MVVARCLCGTALAGGVCFFERAVVVVDACEGERWLW